MYYEQKDLPKSILRHRITGSLTTETPLHVGDGERLKIVADGRDCDRGFLNKEDPEYATVMIDHSGKPVIPATSLKGVLRAWATAHNLDAQLVREVFGDPQTNKLTKTEPADRRRMAGLVTFHDSPMQIAAKPADPATRMWSAKRTTSLTPQVSIEPRTRTAAEHLLYYVEYVPPGAVFETRFTMQGATDEQRGLLLFVLENAFQSGVRPARLGSETASGWGAVNWKLGELAGMDPHAWMSGEMKPWHEALQPLPPAEKKIWLGASKKFGVAVSPDIVKLRLRLAFEGAVLVNDPSRRKKAEGTGEPVSHAAIRTDNGDAFLPSFSVRGAFRAQARRIWQTLASGHEASGHEASRENLNETRHAQAPRKEDVPQLAAFLKLFGATGWRSPFEVSDFRIEGQPEFRPQEFVAVDRFTGGGAKGRKFRAEGLWRPTFTGEMQVRADRLQKAGAASWPWLLLAFALRDWIEGDGLIGFGVSKGYGAFRASVEVTGSSAEARLLKGILARDPEMLRSPDIDAWWRSLQELLAMKEAA